MAARSDFENVALSQMESVFRAAVALARNRAQAEDLTQTTFLKAFEKFHTFRAGTSCRAWLMRILRNTWIDLLRHRQAGPDTVSADEHLLAAEEPVEETAWTDAADLLQNFSDPQVIEALKRLPDDQRLSLFLVDVEGFSQEEAAEVLGVAVGTIKSRTHRARAAMKEILTRYAKELGYPGHRA